MDTQQLQFAAGTASSLIFASSNLSMLAKAFKTKELKSYSLGNIVLANVGNLVYWVYVASLPPGPIWFLHGFYTVTSALMLIWYLAYEKGWKYTGLVRKLNTTYNQQREMARHVYKFCQKWLRDFHKCQCDCWATQSKDSRTDREFRCCLRNKNTCICSRLKLCMGKGERQHVAVTI